MGKMNILYAPLIIAFLIIYLALFFTLGLIIGVNKFDDGIKAIYKFYEEKIYFQIFCFVANIYCAYWCWILTKDYWYNLINAL